MKDLLVLQLILTSQLLATQENNNEKIRTQKNIQVQIEKEKKYAKERTFYSEKKYNFKDAEVNMESVKNLPDVPNHNEDFDMDDAYD